MLNFLGEGFAIGDFRLTWGIVVVVIIYVVMGFVLSQTAWGRYVYAVGDDAESARLSGVPSKRILLGVYTVAGLIYGIAAWILIGRAGAATPNAASRRQPAQHHRGRHRRHQPLRRPRPADRHRSSAPSSSRPSQFGLSQMGVDQQWRVLATGVLVIVAVAVDQWIRKVKA